MTVQRLECKDCEKIRQEKIHFATGKRTYTHRLERLVVELSRIGRIKDVESFLHLTWDTVEDIQKRYLKSHYSNPLLDGVKRIGIDEFSIAKGQVYKTIVIDMDSGRVIHVGNGKGSDSLTYFWTKVKKQNLNIEAVATYFSPAFISAVMKNIPQSALVFDHCHVVKILNDKNDKIRRDLYRQETDLNKRSIIKGIRWLLLKNGDDIFE